MMSENPNDFILWCGNLTQDVTEDLLYELFLQAGPLESVRIAKDKASGRNRDFAFIQFKHIESVPYTMKLMNGIRLFGNPLKLQARPGSVHDQNQRNSFHGQQPQMQPNHFPGHGGYGSPRYGLPGYAGAQGAMMIPQGGMMVPPMMSPQIMAPQLMMDGGLMQRSMSLPHGPVNMLDKQYPQHGTAQSLPGNNFTQNLAPNSPGGHDNSRGRRDDRHSNDSSSSRNRGSSDYSRDRDSDRGRNRDHDRDRGRDRSRDYDRDRDRGRDQSRDSDRDRYRSRDSDRDRSRDSGRSRDGSSSSHRDGGAKAEGSFGDMGYYKGGHTPTRDMHKTRQNVLEMQQRVLDQHSITHQQQMYRQQQQQQQWNNPYQQNNRRY